MILNQLFNEGTNWHTDPEQQSMDATRRARLGREREPAGSDAIDAKLAANNNARQEYAETGRFWLKRKDSQEHISDAFVGKVAATAAAQELLKQQPELRGNLVITAYGPGEQQPVSEGKVKELGQDLKDKALSDAEFKAKYGKTRAEVRAAMREKPVAEGAGIPTDWMGVPTRLSKNDKKPIKRPSGYDEYIKRGAKQGFQDDPTNPLRKKAKEQGVTEAGNKPLEKSRFGTGDTRTPRDIKSQMSGASDEFVKSTADSKTGPFHSKVAKMQGKMAKSELRRREQGVAESDDIGYHQTSGTKAGHTVSSRKLSNKPQASKSDVTLQSGSMHQSGKSYNFPKGTLFTQLPGGIFAKHPSVPETHTGYGHLIRRSEDNIHAIHSALNGQQGVAEGSGESVSFREMVNVVDEHYPKYYAELSGSDISDEQFKQEIISTYNEITNKQGVAEGLEQDDPMAKSLGKYAYYAITAEGYDEPQNPYPVGTKAHADFEEGYEYAYGDQNRKCLAASPEQLARYFNVKDRIHLLNQGVAEGVRDLGYDAQSLIMKLRRDVEEKRLQPTPQAVLAAARELAGDMEFAPQLLVKQVLGQGVAEGSATTWEVSFDYGPHQSDSVKVKARSAQEAVEKVETAAEKKGRSIMVNWARPAEQDVAEGNLKEFATGGEGGNGPFDYGSAIVRIGQDFVDFYNDEGSGADAAAIVKVGKTFMSAGMAAGIKAFYAMDTQLRDHVAEQLADEGFNVRQDIYQAYQNAQTQSTAQGNETQTILSLLKEFVKTVQEPEDRETVANIYTAFQQSLVKGFEALYNAYEYDIDANFTNFARARGIDLNDIAEKQGLEEAGPRMVDQFGNEVQRTSDQVVQRSTEPRELRTGDSRSSATGVVTKTATGLRHTPYGDVTPKPKFAKELDEFSMEGNYDRDDYYNARQGREYGKDLTATGYGGDGAGTRQDDIFKGQSKNLPADPFRRTSGAVPYATKGQQHRIALPGEVDEGEKVGNMDADKFDAAMARLKQLAGAGPMKTVYDPAKRVYRNMPTAQQPGNKK